MTAGFQIEIHHPKLGSSPPKVETVYVLAETQEGARTLVRTALQLDDQPLHVVRTLAETEWKEMGLKPYQVKHA